MDKTLQIYLLCSQGSRALGPGLRYVVWVQGCPFRCVHCQSPESRPYKGGTPITVEALADDIVSRPNIEGLTISGGEPFAQAAGLADMLDIVHNTRPDLTVITFTGYMLEQLVSPDALRMLKHIDVLIDGPYLHEKNDGVGLRGSSNQRIHHLTNRLSQYADQMAFGPRKYEAIVRGDSVSIIGMLKYKNNSQIYRQ